MRYLALVTIIEETRMIDCTLSTFVHGCGIVNVSSVGIGWPPHGIALSPEQLRSMTSGLRLGGKTVFVLPG